MAYCLSQDLKPASKELLCIVQQKSIKLLNLSDQKQTTDETEQTKIRLWICRCFKNDPNVEYNWFSCLLVCNEKGFEESSNDLTYSNSFFSAISLSRFCPLQNGKTIDNLQPIVSDYLETFLEEFRMGIVYNRINNGRILNIIYITLKGVMKPSA